ncbi:unnamed protein product [Absidia cylindrospora]
MMLTLENIGGIGLGSTATVPSIKYDTGTGNHICLGTNSRSKSKEAHPIILNLRKPRRKILYMALISLVVQHSMLDHLL